MNFRGQPPPPPQSALPQPIREASPVGAGAFRTAALANRGTIAAPPIIAYGRSGPIRQGDRLFSTSRRTGAEAQVNLTQRRSYSAPNRQHIRSQFVPFGGYLPDPITPESIAYQKQLDEELRAVEEGKRIARRLGTKNLDVRDTRELQEELASRGAGRVAYAKRLVEVFKEADRVLSSGEDATRAIEQLENVLNSPPSILPDNTAPPARRGVADLTAEQQLKRLVTPDPGRSALVDERKYLGRVLNSYKIAGVNAGDLLTDRVVEALANRRLGRFSDGSDLRAESASQRANREAGFNRLAEQDLARGTTQVLENIAANYSTLRLQDLSEFPLLQQAVENFDYDRFNRATQRQFAPTGGGRIPYGSGTDPELLEAIGEAPKKTPRKASEKKQPLSIEEQIANATDSLNRRRIALEKSEAELDKRTRRLGLLSEASDDQSALGRAVSRVEAQEELVEKRIRLVREANVKLYDLKAIRDNPEQITPFEQKQNQIDEISSGRAFKIQNIQLAQEELSRVNAERERLLTDEVSQSLGRIFNRRRSNLVSDLFFDGGPITLSRGTEKLEDEFPNRRLFRRVSREDALARKSGEVPLSSQIIQNERLLLEETGAGFQLSDAEIEKNFSEIARYRRAVRDRDELLRRAQPRSEREQKPFGITFEREEPRLAPDRPSTRGAESERIRQLAKRQEAEVIARRERTGVLDNQNIHPNELNRIIDRFYSGIGSEYESASGLLAGEGTSREALVSNYLALDSLAQVYSKYIAPVLGTDVGEEEDIIPPRLYDARQRAHTAAFANVFFEEVDKAISSEEEKISAAQANIALLETQAPAQRARPGGRRSRRDRLRAQRDQISSSQRNLVQLQAERELVQRLGGDLEDPKKILRREGIIASSVNKQIGRADVQVALTPQELTTLRRSNFANTGLRVNQQGIALLPGEQSNRQAGSRQARAAARLSAPVDPAIARQRNAINRLSRQVDRAAPPRQVSGTPANLSQETLGDGGEDTRRRLRLERPLTSQQEAQRRLEHPLDTRGVARRTGGGARVVGIGAGLAGLAALPPELAGIAATATLATALSQTPIGQRVLKSAQSSAENLINRAKSSLQFNQAQQATARRLSPQGIVGRETATGLGSPVFRNARGSLQNILPSGRAGGFISPRDVTGLDSLRSLVGPRIRQAATSITDRIAFGRPLSDEAFARQESQRVDNRAEARRVQAERAAASRLSGAPESAISRLSDPNAAQTQQRINRLTSESTLQQDRISRLSQAGRERVNRLADSRLPEGSDRVARLSQESVSREQSRVNRLSEEGTARRIRSSTGPLGASGVVGFGQALSGVSRNIASGTSALGGFSNAVQTLSRTGDGSTLTSVANLHQRAAQDALRRSGEQEVRTRSRLQRGLSRAGDNLNRVFSRVTRRFQATGTARFGPYTVSATPQQFQQYSAAVGGGGTFTQNRGIFGRARDAFSGRLEQRRADRAARQGDGRLGSSVSGFGYGAGILLSTIGGGPISGAIGGLIQAAASVNNPYLLAYAASQVGQSVREIAQRSNELNSIDLSFGNITANTIGQGSGEAVLDRLRSNYGTIATDSELQLFTNRILAIDAASSIDEVDRLAEIGLGLGKAFGRSPEESIRRFSLFLSNESIRRADEFGISAIQIRRRREELKEIDPSLTSSERFYIAANEGAARALEKIGGPRGITTDAEAFGARINRLSEDVIRGIGKTFIEPAATGLELLLPGGVQSLQERRVAQQFARDPLAQDRFDERLERNRFDIREVFPPGFNLFDAGDDVNKTRATLFGSLEEQRAIGREAFADTGLLSYGVTPSNRQNFAYDLYPIRDRPPEGIFGNLLNIPAQFIKNIGGRGGTGGFDATNQRFLNEFDSELSRLQISATIQDRDAFFASAERLVQQFAPASKRFREKYYQENPELFAPVQLLSQDEREQITDPFLREATASGYLQAGTGPGTGVKFGGHQLELSTLGLGGIFDSFGDYYTAIGNEQKIGEELRSFQILFGDLSGGAREDLDSLLGGRDIIDSIRRQGFYTPDQKDALDELIIERGGSVNKALDVLVGGGADVETVDIARGKVKEIQDLLDLDLSAEGLGALPAETGNLFALISNLESAPLRTNKISGQSIEFAAGLGLPVDDLGNFFPKGLETLQGNITEILSNIVEYDGVFAGLQFADSLSNFDQPGSLRSLIANEEVGGLLSENQRFTDLLSNPEAFAAAFISPERQSDYIRDASIERVLNRAAALSKRNAISSRRAREGLQLETDDPRILTLADRLATIPEEDRTRITDQFNQALSDYSTPPPQSIAYARQGILTPEEALAQAEQETRDVRTRERLRLQEELSRPSPSLFEFLGGRRTDFVTDQYSQATGLPFNAASSFSIPEGGNLDEFLNIQSQLAGLYAVRPEESLQELASLTTSLSGLNQAGLGPGLADPYIKNILGASQIEADRIDRGITQDFLDSDYFQNILPQITDELFAPIGDITSIDFRTGLTEQPRIPAVYQTSRVYGDDTLNEAFALAGRGIGATDSSGVLLERAARLQENAAFEQGEVARLERNLVEVQQSGSKEDIAAAQGALDRVRKIAAEATADAAAATSKAAGTSFSTVGAAVQGQFPQLPGLGDVFTRIGELPEISTGVSGLDSFLENNRRSQVLNEYFDGLAGQTTTSLVSAERAGLVGFDPNDPGGPRFRQNVSSGDLASRADLASVLSEQFAFFSEQAGGDATTLGRSTGEISTLADALSGVFARNAATVSFFEQSQSSLGALHGLTDGGAALDVFAEQLRGRGLSDEDINKRLERSEVSDQFGTTNALSRFASDQNSLFGKYFSFLEQEAPDTGASAAFASQYTGLLGIAQTNAALSGDEVGIDEAQNIVRYIARQQGRDVIPGEEGGLGDYTIQPGDTYSGLAQRFGLSTSELIAQNPYAATALPIGGQLNLGGTGSEIVPFSPDISPITLTPTGLVGGTPTGIDDLGVQTQLQTEDPSEQVTLVQEAISALTASVEELATKAGEIGDVDANLNTNFEEETTKLQEVDAALDALAGKNTSTFLTVYTNVVITGASNSPYAGQAVEAATNAAVDLANNALSGPR